MRIHICAVGRMKPGPERTLTDDYTARFNRTGRALSLGPIDIHEVEDRKTGGMADEAVLLRKSIPDGAVICLLDERGRAVSSTDFARLLARWRDDGQRDAAFLIGGADGLDPGLRPTSHLTISLGPMVWPHMLARVLLTEQLYRAAGILAGTPYHRE